MAFFAAPTRKLISELSVFAGKDAKNLSEEVKVAHRETHAKIARRLIQSLSCARQREPNAVCPTSVSDARTCHCPWNSISVSRIFNRSLRSFGRGTRNNDRISLTDWRYSLLKKRLNELPYRANASRNGRTSSVQADSVSLSCK